MLVDTLTEFCDGESVANGAGTDLIGDVINIENLRDIGNNGKPAYLVIQAATDIITGGAAGTLTFQLASDAQAAIDTAGGATVHFATGALVTDGVDATSMLAGTVMAVIALPLEGAVYEQFLGILAVTATTTITAGTIDAFLTMDPPRWKSYADNNK